MNSMRPECGLRNFKHENKAFNYRLTSPQCVLANNQLKRIDRSIKPVDVITKGRFDEYGQDYEFGPEFAGLFGFGSSRSDWIDVRIDDTS